MSIDREELTTKQKTIYDMWITLKKGDPDDPELEKLLVLAGMPKSKIRAISAERQEVLRREAELVFKHLYNQKKPLTTVCKNCEELFVTDYEYAKHCSDECLRRSLEKLGLAWNPEKTPQERWNAVQPPCIVEPESVKAVWPEQPKYGSVQVSEEQFNCSMRDVTAEISYLVAKAEDDAINHKIFEDDPFAEFR